MIRVEVVNDSASSTILSAMNERLELIIRGEETTNKTEYDISSQRIKKCREKKYKIAWLLYQ